MSRVHSKRKLLHFWQRQTLEFYGRILLLADNDETKPIYRGVISELL